MAVAKGKKTSSMLTKTGKTRLGPLNVAQLTAMLEKSGKPKEKVKIARALAQRVKTQAVSTKVEKAVAEETVQATE